MADAWVLSGTQMGKRILALGIAAFLAILGLALSLAALLLIFAEGPLTPRNYSPEERARNRVMGALTAAGALASFGGAGGALWWGFRRPPNESDQPAQP